MNNFFKLVKVNLLEIFYNSRKKKKAGGGAGQAGTILLFLVLFAFVAFAVFTMAMGMGEAMAAVGLLPMLLLIALSFSTIFVLVLCIYRMPGFLFSFKDFDLLMSMPIKPSVILGSKLFTSYLENLGAAALVSLPFMIVYGIMTGAGIAYYLLMILICLFIPLLPMTVGGLLAFGLAKLATKLKMKNLVMIVGMVLVMGLAFAWSFGAQTLTETEGIMASLGMFNQIGSVLFTSRFFVEALSGPNLLSLLIFIGISLGLFALFILLFGRAFRHINTAMRQITGRRRKGKTAKIEVRSPLGALLHKEIRTYFGSFIYIFNTCVGVVLATLLAIVAVILGPTALSFLADLQMVGPDFAPFILMMIFSFFIACGNICAPSISIEGSRFYILRALPIDPKDVFRAKLLLHVIITLPLMVLDAAVLCAVLQFSLADTLLFIVYVAVFVVFIGTLGLSMNLKFPRLDYKDDMTAVKQSASVFSCIMIGMVLAFLPLLPLFLNWPMTLFSAGMIVLYAGAALLLWQFITHGGVRIFRSLQA